MNNYPKSPLSLVSMLLRGVGTYSSYFNFLSSAILQVSSYQYFTTTAVGCTGRCRYNPVKLSKTHV